MINEPNKDIFIELIGFNDPIFLSLDEKIRPLLAKKEYSLSRELQIRTLLYTNFNNYLKIRLLRNNEDKAIEIIKNLDNVAELDRLAVISSIINMSIEEIISNFVSLFKK